MNIITLKRVNVKPRGCDKMCMNKDLIEDKLYQLAGKFNERKINHRDFSSALLSNMHSFYGENGRTWKILFVSAIFL